MSDSGELVMATQQATWARPGYMKDDRALREYRDRIERIAAQIAVAWLGSNRPQALAEEKAFEIAKGIVDRVDAAYPAKGEDKP